MLYVNNLINEQFYNGIRAITGKKTWEGKTACDIFFYGWLVLKFFKLYGSLVSGQI